MTSNAPAPRDRLLAAVIDHVQERGVTDLSLRELAAAVGTSHRMLLYHFGSREELLVAVAREVEARQVAAMAGLAADEGRTTGEAIQEAWAHFADPALAANERLFFELYGQALQGRPGTTALLDGVVDTWVDAIAAAAVERGRPAAEARDDARLAVAVLRGLLLDLLATGDRAAVDAAAARWAAMVDLLEAHEVSEAAGAV